jgi:putative NADPH-quinone reductase
MRISVVLAHPDPNSFNHAIARAVLCELDAAKHEVFFHDLYAENFDPILHAEEIPSNAPIPTDLVTHCKEISVAEGIVVIHPNWWGQPPAILKGWVDRVIRPGVAYRFEDGDTGEGIPVGLLEAKFALVFNTSNTSTQREARAFGDPLQSIWKQCVFDLCGVTNFHREMFNIIVTSTATQRESWLLTTREIVKRFAQPSKHGITG